MLRLALTILFIGLGLIGSWQMAFGQAIIVDHLSVNSMEQVPSEVIATASSGFNCFYIHTSHGSQIVTGLSMVYAENSSYLPPAMVEPGSDLGHNGDTSWAPTVRTYLNSNPSTNLVALSWCAGVSDNNEAGINSYLDKMNALETDYSAVKFIYMTGHLDGTGVEGNLYRGNNQIRAYCLANNKILFDFADIESYDPDGIYYPDETDACNWCVTWCDANPTCPSCSSCAHSHCFNCYQKGQAWWWMLARLTGWGSIEYSCGMYTGGFTGNTNCDSGGLRDLADIICLIDNVYISKLALCCPENGNVNGDAGGLVNLADITKLIDHVYITKAPTAACE